MGQHIGWKRLMIIGTSSQRVDVDTQLYSKHGIPLSDDSMEGTFPHTSLFTSYTLVPNSKPRQGRPRRRPSRPHPSSRSVTTV